MMICCPMSSRIKGYAFEVVLTARPPSVVLADQVRNLDWKARRATRKSVAPPEVLRAVQRKVKVLLGL
jgi:mRNA interferase MazF